MRGHLDKNGNTNGLEAIVYLGEPEGDETQPAADELLKDFRQMLIEQPNYKRITHVTIRKEPFPKTTSQKVKRQLVD